MKYSADQGGISNFVVGRAGSEYGLPVVVIFVFCIQSCEKWYVF
ncbi:hypothetical protein [Desulfocicer vacuolatum]|nr:hypothetical protein [Desulfocicer vacuolatum]